MSSATDFSRRFEDLPLDAVQRRHARLTPADLEFYRPANKSALEAIHDWESGDTTRLCMARDVLRSCKRIV
jgi:hypothetical protein